MKRPHALCVMRPNAFDSAFGPNEQQRLASLVDIVAPPLTPDQARALPPPRLSDVELLITSWGAPTLDAAWLDRLPNLTAVFHAAGSVSRLMTLDAWRRGIVVTTAVEANAVPVAEYTVAMIVMCLKRVWRLAMEMRTCRAAPSRAEIAGCAGAIVGLVSLGAIGRLVAANLARFDVSTIACDPHVSPDEARSLGVTLVDLDDLFRLSDVVSVHAPHLPSTERIITGAHFCRMKRGASFINTSHAAVLREDELIDVAARRDDLQFVLDVAEAMPPEPESQLYTLPNVLLTPHIAGSRGNEVRRMGQWIVNEIERYVRGIPLRSRLTFDAALTTSHRPIDVVA